MKNGSSFNCAYRSILFRSSVAEELPHFTNFQYLVEVQIGNDKKIFVTRRFGNDFSARRAEIALSVKLSDIPGRLMADTVNSSDEISICNGVCGLF